VLNQKARFETLLEGVSCQKDRKHVQLVAHELECPGAVLALDDLRGNFLAHVATEPPLEGLCVRFRHLV
jgi:hypothetical protein